MTDIYLEQKEQNNKKPSQSKSSTVHTTVFAVIAFGSMWTLLTTIKMCIVSGCYKEAGYLKSVLEEGDWGGQWTVSHLRQDIFILTLEKLILNLLTSNTHINADNNNSLYPGYLCLDQFYVL